MQASFDLEFVCLMCAKSKNDWMPIPWFTSQILNPVQRIEDMPPRREVGPLSKLALDQVKPLVKHNNSFDQNATKCCDLKQTK